MLYGREAELEDHLRRMLFYHLGTNANFQILKSKKVGDIIICREGPNPAAFFIEAKLYTPKKNRMGIGSGSGAGFQPEILSKRPLFFEKFLRWVICHDNREDRQFVLATTEIVSQHVAGESIEAKHNNIRTSIFDAGPLLNLSELFDAIKAWVTTP